MSSVRLLVVAAAVAILAAPVAMADPIDDVEETAPSAPARRERPVPPPPPPPAAKPAPAPAPAPMAADVWRFELATWLWMPAVDGDSTLQGTDIDIDLDFGDTFGSFDGYGVAGRFEGWRKRWGSFVEVGWMDLDADSFGTLKNTGLDLDMDVERLNVDFGFAYQGVREELGDGRLFTLDVLVGGRWAQIRQRASAGFGRPFRASDREDYWEPFVGTRFGWDLTDKIPLRIGGDVGGFGAGSDFSWNALAEIGYKILEPLELRLGYGAQGVDYDSGSGTGKFKLDTIAHGPRFGMALHF